MSFDPAADPWATAMIAAAALFLLSLLVLVAAQVARTERRSGGRMMLIALGGFFVFAIAGTWQRLQSSASDDAALSAADATVAGASATGPVSASEDEPAHASSGGTSADGAEDADPTTEAPEQPETTGGAAGETTTGASGTTGVDEASTGAPDATTGDVDDGAGDDGATSPEFDPEFNPKLEPGTEPAVALRMPEVDPLPTDPDKRKWAIIQILRDTEQVANSPRSCARLDSVAKAWAQLRQVPSTSKSREIAKNLDKCRRKLLYSISRRRRRDAVNARDQFAEGLATTLRKQEGTLFWVSISGQSHERLRIGAARMDAARADGLMKGGLREDLKRLAFAHVVLSDGKHSKTYEFEVTPDSELGQPDMEAVGLGQTLSMSE